ncbi:AAA family ATPase [Empedobacter brevis]
MNNKKYILTGGPGVGKTTLINKLTFYGFPVIQEDARQIIKEQSRVNGDGLPWKNKSLYANLMLEASINSYQKSVGLSNEHPIFFDRGIPDALCYFNMENLPITLEKKTFAESLRYNLLVFILPPWAEIYETDTERKQTWKEAEKTFSSMKETYENLKYTVLEIPKDSVENRIKFIFNSIESSE